MTSIGLVSDTHLWLTDKELPHQVAETLSGVDLILHAGDIFVLPVLDWLEKIAPVLAARGNNDWHLPPDPRLDEHQLLKVEGLRVGLAHMRDLPDRLPHYPLAKIMRQEFGGAVDVFVFGDTHVAMVERHDGVLLVNPGSPTFPNNMDRCLGTVGRLDIESGQATARIIQLK
ncbi:MAG: metallophosphoesterase family protein [Chloroflexota bacterium]